MYLSELGTECLKIKFSQAIPVQTFSMWFSLGPWLSNMFWYWLSIQKQDQQQVCTEEKEIRLLPAAPSAECFLM